MLLLNVVAEQDLQRCNDLLAKIEAQDTKVLAQYAMPTPLRKMATTQGVLKQIEDARGSTALVCTLTMDGDQPKIEEHTFLLKVIAV